MIARFQGPHRFLSNFWLADVIIHDHVFPSSEHAYQAMKCARPEDWRRFQDRALSPAGAKRLVIAAPIPRRPDWYELRVAHMRYVVYDKFTRHPDLRASLLATRDEELVEGNHWGDVFWGVCRGKGENWLGRILMETRQCLRAR